MLRKRIVFMVVLALVLLLTACAPERPEVDNQTLDEGTEGEPAKPEQLVVWAHYEDWQEETVEALQQITQAYTEQTGIEVVIERVPLPDQVDELTLAGPAGNGPDLFYQPHDRLGDIVVRGLAVPIEMDDETKAGYLEQALDAVTAEGKIYGAPAVIETYALYYNANLIESAPKTLEELMEMARELRDPGKDRYGFLMSPEFYYVVPFILNYGGYIFGGEPGAYDPLDIGLNSEGAVTGVEKFQEFYEEGLFPSSLTVDVIDGLFTEGKAAAVISGPWNIQSYSKAVGDALRTAPLFEINGKPGSSFLGVKSWLVSYFSEHPEWAQDLALFMTNEENSKLYYELVGELPPRPSILDQVDDPLYEGFAQQMQHGVPMPNIPAMGQVWEAMNDALFFVTEGEDVEEVLEEAVDQIRENIEALMN